MRLVITSRETISRYCAAINHAVTNLQFRTSIGFLAANKTLQYQCTLLESFPASHHYISSRDGIIWPIEKLSN